MEVWCALLLCFLSGVRGDGKYWWMETGAFGDSSGSSDYQQGGGGGVGGVRQVDGGNSLQGNQGNSFGLPATQGLSNLSPQGSCPSISPLPPVSSCTGSTSNCWSVGYPDVDCVDDALCCFDGCVNVCQGAGSRSPAPPPNPRPQAQTQTQTQKQSQTQTQTQTQTKTQPQKQTGRQPVQQFVQQQTPPVQKTKPRRPQTQKTRPRRPQTQKSKQKRPQTKKSKPRAPQPQPTQPANDPWPQQSQSSQGGPVVRPPVVQQSPSTSGSIVPADTKPFVRCPSAMKCVPKINCDFEGVMTNEVFNVSPDLEMLRVPLIPCINRAAGNVVDVCCRDPNYKDPWPDMQGGQGNMGGGGRQNNNNRINKSNNNGNNYG